IALQVNSYLAKINSTDFPSEMARDAHNVSFNDLHNVRSGSMMVYLHQYSGDKLGFTSQQLFRYNWETFQNGSMKNTTNFKEFKSNFKFIERLARESCGWNDFIRTLLRMPDLDCQKRHHLLHHPGGVVVAVVGFRYVNHQQMKRQMFLDEPLMELKQRLADIEVPRDRVSVNRKLGEGAFGIVLGGGEVQLKNQWIPCALKSLRDTASNSEKCTFLSGEATLMRQFKHSNIVCLLAVSTQEEPFYAIMEMCLHGDLKTYLISRRVHAREPGEFSASLPTTLTNFAIDIAKGLEYLHGVKYIHRDVALRNCLVTDKLTIKICDFGLAREVSDKKDYYRFDRRGMLPVRWMSPEAIQYGLFTYKSDVWSYAIVLYEIVTFGKFPYGSRSNEEVCDAVKRGDTLLEHLPVDVNPLLRNLMACCWSFEHDKRPTMTEVAEELARHPGCVAACLEEAPPSQPLDYLGFRRINRDDKLRGSSGSVRSVTNSTKRPQQSVEQLNKLNSTSSHSLAAAYVASSTAAKAHANDLRGQQILQLRRNNSGLPMEAIRTASSDASMRLLSELSISSRQPPGPAQAAPPSCSSHAGPDLPACQLSTCFLRGTVAQILALRRVIEKARTCQSSLIVLFIDFRKASVRRVGRRQPERQLSVLGSADDLALLSSTVEGAQRRLDRLESIAATVGLVVNTQKTVQFVYLGGLVSDDREDLRHRSGLPFLDGKPLLLRDFAAARGGGLQQQQQCIQRHIQAAGRSGPRELCRPPAFCLLSAIEVRR
uniref:Protein kinase domain-containing protein n=1 Tax=Macrostomum lignano TaxID=282301 RepID=A0A1I8HT82_9PLAT